MIICCNTIIKLCLPITFIMSYIFKILYIQNDIHNPDNQTQEVILNVELDISQAILRKTNISFKRTD